MDDTAKTNERLVAELVALRRENAALRASRAEQQRQAPAYQDAEQPYRTLVEQASDAIVIVQDGQTVYRNPAAVSLIGYTVAETAGRSFLEWIAPADRDRVREFSHRRLRGEPAPDSYEVELLPRDGKQLIMELEPRMIRYRGKPATMVVMHDITARKGAEAALRESEARYSALVEHSLAGIYIIQDGRYRYVNPRFAEIFGYTPHEIVTHLRHGHELIVEADRPLVRANVEKRLRGEAETLHYTFRGRRKNGTVIEVEVHGAAMEYQGRPAVIGTLLDITERKRAEEALQEKEERYRSLVEGSLQGIAISRCGLYLFVNAALASILGYQKPEELVGRSIWEHVAPHELDRLRSYFEARWQGEPAPARYEYQAQKTDGTLIWIERLISPIIWEGEFAYLSTCLDITERKRLEDQLRQAQKMEAIGTLAGGIAHDFNNLLAVILGYTELALFKMPPASPARQDLQEVRAAGIRAKDLVQQILTFSHQQEQTSQPLDLRQVVTEALRLLRASLPTTIEIRQHLSDATGVVMADATHMYQVLMNLCANAEQAMRETGGVLEIRLEPVEVEDTMATTHPALCPGPYVRLSVRDTGSGIAPDVKTRLFDPFFTTKPPGEGTGLGLAVVHGIVTTHGGAITVESTPGHGATFAVYLPQIEAAAADPASLETPLPTGTERILFVDDEEPLAHWGQLLLERLGYRVTVRTNGREALEAFRVDPHRFDLVITDQTMPQMTGDILARALRDLRPDLPVILCTGYSHLITAEHAEAKGIDALCLKPLLARDLASTIRRVLAHHQPGAGGGNGSA
jgi:PAS domain S-box-containing protein